MSDDDANLCTLLIGGTAYGGWTGMEVHSGIEHIAGGFCLEVTNRYPGVDVPMQLREGLSCEVRIGDDLVITGYIDEYETEDAPDHSSVKLTGRDKTGDLVDCSAIYKTGLWRGVKLEQICADIAKPFGIKVEVAKGVSTGEAFKRFALEEGELAFHAIDRACRLRALLCTSTPEGNLQITSAGNESSGVSLVEGENMKRFSSRHSWKERHSEITLKGQVPGDDQEWGATVAHLKATAKDTEIDRYRPLVVIAEHGTSSKALHDRATWENKVRMGRGKRGETTVVGWRTGKDGQEGPLWRKNTLVTVTSERMDIGMEMLIVSCVYKIDEKDGKVTHITFARREAFELVEGIGRSRLNAKLNDKTQKEKKKKKDGYNASFSLDPPKGTAQ